MDDIVLGDRVIANKVTEGCVVAIWSTGVLNVKTAAGARLVVHRDDVTVLPRPTLPPNHPGPVRGVARVIQ